MSNAVSTESPADDRKLQAEIDALRGTCRDTQDLYHEVCVLLFFRHGITPTANKLYQLVRKGSMSAPAEALSRFWQMLREKSRVRIEHPDLPEELRHAAGEAIGALWQRAQALADAGLATTRSEAQASVIQAQAAMESAQARADVAEQALINLKVELSGALARMQQLEQDFAREQGARAAMERQTEQAAVQRQDLHRALEDARLGFAAQLAEQRDAVNSSEERHQADLRRALLDVDRERSASTKLQKDLDQSRRLATEQAIQHRAQADRLEGELTQLRQKLIGAEAALAEARAAGDQLRTRLDNALFKPVRKASAKKVKS